MSGTIGAKSEGIAELIERLAVATFKGEATAAEGLQLGNKIGGPAAQLVEKLIAANRELWAVKDEQAEAVRNGAMDAVRLRDLISRDLQLCERRAAIRAELNECLGGVVSSESMKRYGGNQRVEPTQSQSRVGPSGRS